MKSGTKDCVWKLLGIGLFLLSLALGHVHCGTAECGGTETGNPTTCTTQNSPSTEGGDSSGSDTSSEDSDSSTADDGDTTSTDSDDDGTASDPASDNDLSVTPSLSDPFLMTLAWGDDADPDIEAATLAFDNEADFATFWEEFFGEDETMPDVDFSTHVVAAAVMGGQSTDGYALTFTDQQIEGNTLVLTLTETVPGPDCAVTANTTNPYHVISVPTTGEDLSLEWETVENDCE